MLQRESTQTSNLTPNSGAGRGGALRELVDQEEPGPLTFATSGKLATVVCIVLFVQSTLQYKAQGPSPLALACHLCVADHGLANFTPARSALLLVHCRPAGRGMIPQAV